MEPEQKSERIAKLEALLFLHGEPLSFKRIHAVLDIPEHDLEELIGELGAHLADGARGLALVHDREKVQLVTKPNFGSLMETFMKEELSGDLTPASLEALAIIAYLGPISRSRIEYLRGVNSTFTLRNLLLRGLISRSPDPQSPSGYLYGPSFELLKHLGVEQKENLPDYQKFQSLVATFENRDEQS